MTERIWFIKRCQLFESLTAEQLSQLEKHARVRQFPKNGVVYLPADQANGVLLLAEGRIKICNITSDGKEAILTFIEPGEVFGELAIFGGGEREELAKTVLASTVVLLPVDEVTRMMEQATSLALGITKLVGFRRRRVERRLKNLLFRSNRERLVHLFLELGETYGKDTPEGTLLDIPLSHQDIASLIGSTRESVTVLLGEFQLHGALKLARQRVIVRSWRRLQAEMGETGTGQAPTSPNGSSTPSKLIPVRRAKPEV